MDDEKRSKMKGFYENLLKNKIVGAGGGPNDTNRKTATQM
jgi:hypothetical protein